MDLSLSYDTGDMIDLPLLRNTVLSMNVTDLLDEDPPFVLNAASTNPVLYDPMNVNPIGRSVTLKLQKRW